MSVRRTFSRFPLVKLTILDILAGLMFLSGLGNFSIRLGLAYLLYMGNYYMNI